MTPSRFHTISTEMYQAYHAAEFPQAEALAGEFLRLAEENRENWHYGNAIHHANLILGSVALQRECTDEAGNYLIRAGRTPGSPQLNTFGPNMALAEKLLKRGERKNVLQYLDAVAVFWQPFFSTSKLSRWKQRIDAGKVPDFGANLRYGM